MIYLSLGTNLGDREWNIEQAKAMLAGALKVDMLYSGAMETEAVGFDGEPFLNEVVAFEADIEPEPLLDICQEIERRMGRPAHKAAFDAEGRRIYENRIIDIDILLFNGLEINTERLTVPHPQVVGRPFVKELIERINL